MLSVLPDGLYRLDYRYSRGNAETTGGELALLRRDAFFGSDPGGGVFHGTLAWDTAHERYSVQGSLIVASGAETITDVIAGADGMECRFSATGTGTSFTAEIAGRQIGVEVSYLVPLPKECGAQSAMTNSAKRILLGEIVSVHGIRGDVVIRSHARAPQAFETYGPLTDAGGARSYTIRVVRSGPKGVVAHVAGVDDRTAAEALRGTELYAERARLPAPEAGEYYHADLVGLAAFDAHGAPIGTIRAVHNYGAGDFLEIVPGDAAGGEHAGSELVPFTDQLVPVVDLAAGRVTVRLPESVEADDEGG